MTNDYEVVREVLDDLHRADALASDGTRALAAFKRIQAERDALIAERDAYLDSLRIMGEAIRLSQDEVARLRALHPEGTEPCPTCGAYPSQRGTATLIPFTSTVCSDGWHGPEGTEP